MSSDRRRSPPKQELLEEQFRLTFNRDMTPEERKFYHLAGILLDSDEQELDAANREKIRQR